MNPDPDRMNDVAEPQTTVAGKIRALDAAGYARADIARFLGKRYQQVRNVLEDDARRTGGGYVVGRADLSGLQEGPRPFDREADDFEDFVESRSGKNFRLVVRPDGSIYLPVEVVAAFGLKPGGVVMGNLDGDDFNLVSAETALRRIQAMVRELVPPGVSLADELIADRRREAEADGNG